LHLDVYYERPPAIEMKARQQHLDEFERKQRETGRRKAKVPPIVTLTQLGTEEKSAIGVN